MKKFLIFAVLIGIQCISCTHALQGDHICTKEVSVEKVRQVQYQRQFIYLTYEYCLDITKGMRCERMKVGYKPAYKNETYKYIELRDVCCDGYKQKDEFCIPVDQQESVQDNCTGSSDSCQTNPSNAPNGPADEDHESSCYWKNLRTENGKFNVSCYIDGSDSRSLADIIQNTSVPFERTIMLRLITHQNITIKIHELNAFPNLVSLDIKSYQNPDIHFIDIHTDAMRDKSKITGISVGGAKLLTGTIAFIQSARNLERLSIRNCGITSISGQIFRNMNNLKEISLGYNQISMIKPGAFDTLNSLQVLHLQENRLENLPPNLFNNFLTQLKDLNLSGNWLKQISANTFFGLKALEKLSLANNLIQQVESGSFDDLVNLKSIDLQNNSIGHLPNGLFNNNCNLAGRGMFEGNHIERVIVCNFTLVKPEGMDI